MKCLVPMLSVLLLVLSGCTKEQDIARQIEGDWTVANITITADGQNVVSQEVIARLKFDDCNIFEDPNCSGTATVEGGGTEAYTWTLRDEELSIHSSNPDYEIYWWSGKWTVLENANNRVVIESDNCLECTTLAAVFNVELEK